MNRLRKLIFSKWLFIALIIAEAIHLRIYFINKESGDFICCWNLWLNFIKDNGAFHAFSVAFTDYAPLYFHVLSFMLIFNIKNLFIVKIVSYLFDFIGALVIYKILRLHQKENNYQSLKCASIFLLTPTLILNSAYWGQCDILYSSMILAALYYLFNNKIFVSFIFLGSAFAFKLQTIFIFPFFFLISISNFKNFKYWLLIPAVYIITIIPSLFAGRSFVDLLTIYFKQTKQQDPLSINCPNIYLLIPNAEKYHAFFHTAGIMTTGLICIMLIVCSLFIMRGKSFSIETMIRFSLVSAVTVPFFLPHMHERYYLLADVLSMLYVFYFKRNYFIPIILIAASTFSYLKYLAGFSIINLSHPAFLILLVLIYLIFDLFRNIKQDEKLVTVQV